MRRDLVIAVDVGTTGLKAALVTRELRIAAECVRTYPVNYPRPGWAEQDPADWWMAIRLAVADLASACPDLRERAAAITFAAQMCGVVAADEQGEPLRPAIIWLDKRSAALVRRTMDGFPRVFGYGALKGLAFLHLANGAPSLNGMDPPGKMMWIMREEQEIGRRCHKYLDVKDWILHKCCGRFVTTADSANLTWMMDTRPGHHGWSQRLAARFGIPLSKLPDIVPGTMSPGGLTPEAAAGLGLPDGLPVIAGCGDVCAAALGSGAIGDGELHMSLGTSAWIGGFYPGRRLSATEGYATITSPIANRDLLIATQESLGNCLLWIDRLTGEPDDTEARDGTMDALPLFLPWLAGERVPVSDDRLRGAFLGLSLTDGPARLRRSVVEGVTLNLRWAFQSVVGQRSTSRDFVPRIVGGGALNEELCQAAADSLNRPIAVGPEPRSAGVRGVAALAAVHLDWSGDVWQAIRNADDVNASQRIYRPDPVRAAYFDRRFRLFKDAHGRLAPWFRNSFSKEWAMP